jgi:hypothetical protein
MKIFKCFLILVALLSACSPAASATPSPTSQAINTPASSTQPPAPTFAPLPSQTFNPAPSQTLTPIPIPTQTSAPTPTISPEANVVLERVAQLGGSINGITIVGDVAYVGMGPRVAAIDISQHDSPMLVGQSELMPGLVTQLVQVSKGATPLLAVAAGKYLVIIDISSPNALKSVNQLELPGSVSALVWDPNLGIVYAGGSIYQAPFEYTGFIAALPFTLDHQLTLLNSIPLPEQPFCLALGEGSLYVGTVSNTGGLYRIALNAPGVLSTPHLVIASNTADGFTPYSLQVVGDRLYAGVNMDLQAYDITDPDKPTQVWKEFVGFTAMGFSFSGPQIVIFGWVGAGTYLPEKIVVTTPQPIIGTPVGEVGSITATHRGDFLVAYENLEVYAPHDKQGLELVGSYQPPVIEVLGAATDGQTIYVVDNGTGDGKNTATLRVFNLPDLRPLGQVETDVTNSWGWFSGLAVEGDRAYLAAIDSLWAYDLSNPSPVLLNKLDIIEGPVNAIAAIKPGNRRILILFQELSDSGSLTAYDVADAKRPVRMGSPLKVDQGLIYQMSWDGSTLYAVGNAIYESDNDILYLAGFDGEDLTIRGKIPMPGSILSMAVDDGLVALVGTAGLTLVSALDVQSPKIEAQVNLPERGVGIAILKNTALAIVGGNNGAARLLAFDVQNPANPRQVTSVDIAFSASAISPIPTSNPYMILAGWSTGVEVLECQIRK